MSTGTMPTAWQVSEPFQTLSFHAFYSALNLWYVVVQEVVSDGESTSYPISEVAGQLYAHRIAPNVVVLGTRGLTLESGVDVGLKEIASGLYKCVAVNREANDSQTLLIHVDGRLDIL